ncbi:pirin family protein [Myroides sp. LJL119]
MSNVELVIEERAASIGNFLVGRLLPFRQKRMVGPFAFIDHMGPIGFKDHDNLDVDPHPHIGLSTLTYLFDGQIHHKDSIGSDQVITPGDVNWMNAGKGVVHSERICNNFREKNPDGMLHGLQIWVALPKELENMEPSFVHIDKAELPQWTQDQVTYKLIAGKALGKESPVPVFSDLYFLEIKSSKQATISIGDGLYGESALYILKGSVVSEGHTYFEKNILIAKDSKLCEFQMAPDSVVYIFGGTPFEQPRHLLWNFLSSDPLELQRAKQAWIDQDYSKFPLIKTDCDSYVPFPKEMENFKIKTD